MASFDFVISIYCVYANSIIKFNMSDSNSSSKNDETLKILLTIDGSEQSMQAAEYAIDMAINKERNIQIIAITVIELAKLNLSTFIAAPTYGLEDLEEKKEQAKKWLSKTERLIQDKGKNIEFKSDILENPTLKVSSLILDYAERDNVDLIVVGNRGRHGFKRLLLGSVASDIVTYSHCPVLVIK
jgi:nucleotide-binding universal stress UspA family protein